jgi:hypothetical protein
MMTLKVQYKFKFVYLYGELIKDIYLVGLKTVFLFKIENVTFVVERFNNPQWKTFIELSKYF